MADFAMSFPSVVRPVPLGGKKARGRVAWVDEWNYYRVMQLSWHCWEEHRAGGNIHGPYPMARDPDTGRVVKMHNFITGRKHIDHRNGDGLDCRESNLRDATPTQNKANRGPQRYASSKYKGVSWIGREGKWCAGVTSQGQTCRLGRFPGTPEGEMAAACAHDEAARRLHGEFAWLNCDHFPELRR